MYIRDYSWAAGGFYPTDEREARRILDECMSGALPPMKGNPLLVAGVVPHAGWVFSGPTAGKVFKALSERTVAPKRAVCFGSVHIYGVRKPTAIREGAWRTPLGELSIDAALSARIFDEFGPDIVESKTPHEEDILSR
jgi:AmmeMemoRadiSam system protein B